MALGCSLGVLCKCSTGAGNGVKRREMTPERKFICSKPDFHHMLGLKAINGEGKVLWRWGVA